MYEERKISIKDIIVQLILVVLFVLVILWLFPTKNYLADTYATKDDIKSTINEALDAKLEFLYGRNFADNIATMQGAATSYFTNSRLPQKVGDSVTITLEEMLDKKLLVPFKDSNNKTCDLEDSYVKVTKMDDEYEMKVKLACSDYSDYILVYLGCYDYCDSCDSKPVVKNTNTTTKKPNNNTPTTKPTVSKQYKYRLTTQNEYSNYGSCSAWTQTPIKSDDLTKVEMETRNILQGYEQVWSVIGYDPIYETVYKDVTTSKPTTDRKPATKTTSNGYYSEWAYQGYVTSNYALSTYYDSKSTVRYVYVSDKTSVSCATNPCKNVTTYTYQKYTRSYVAGQDTYSCASYPGYTLSGTECVKTIPGSSTQVTEQKIVGYNPKYGVTNGNPIYKTVKFYCARTRKLINEAKTIYQTSNSDNDQTLINQGYVLVGEV